MEQTIELNYKKLSFLQFNAKDALLLNDERYHPFIKVLYLPEGYSLSVDFNRYITKKNSLFFININQYFQIEKAGTKKGYFIYYNRDFYCVQIHDEEVACDGLLFNNVHQIPMIALSEKSNAFVTNALENIHSELSGNDSSREEMIRTYLKQIIIHATREWKQQHLGQLKSSPTQDIEFFRDFSRLVEIHFREKHSVADYADLLLMSPKNLSKKLNKLNVVNPNDIIKERILLEAKRLLAYTAFSIKEIAYKLGYDDPAYFNRLFSNKAECTPASFRKQFSLTGTEN